MGNSLTPPFPGPSSLPPRGPAPPSLLSPVQFPPQVPRDRLQVHEVAEPAPGALSHLILPAASFSEVSDS